MERISISNQPIIFDILYTPYRLKSNATQSEINAHKQERSFYDMTGGKNILKYLTTEEKLKGESKFLSYLKKSTGLFNQNGMIEQQEIEAMKSRVAANTGNIWHGFLSLNEEESPKIDTPEKCIHLVKRTFGSFFKDAGLDEKNIDLMCALHLDKPHHLHLHFVSGRKSLNTAVTKEKATAKKAESKNPPLTICLCASGYFLTTIRISYR